MHPRTLRVSLRACVSLLGLAIGSSALSGHARAESALPPALPQAGRVLSGSADIASGGRAMTIAQSGQAAVIDWRSFDIGAGNQVTFVQPDAQAVTLNLVTGETASVLSGSLTATGSIVLLNPNGIAITPTGTVDVGSGFAASSLALSGVDEQGRLRFRGNGQSAPVSNAGRITVGAQGFAALVGGSVANSGLVIVPRGRITLAAGETATIDTFGDGFLQIALGDQGAALAGQSATLLQMSGSTAHAAWREVVSLSSDVAATSVRQEGNAVVFGDVPAAGVVALSGRLNASSLNAAGGTITVAGQSVNLAGAQLDVSGTTGGTIAVGGGALGQAVAGMAAAREARLDEGTLLNASGSAGSGGTVTVWGGNLLDYRGQIVATGTGGDGGFAEVSGMGAYVYGGTTNLLSEGGRTGTLLLDPGTIIICRSGDAGCAGATSLAAIQADASTSSTAYLQDTTLASALSSASVALAASVQITDSSSAVAVTTGSGGALTLTAPNITLSGSYGVAGGLTLNNTDTASSISGVISGTGGLTKTGTGTLALTGASSYSGTTTVSGGTLTLAPVSSASIGAINVTGGAAGAILAVTGGSTTVSGDITLGVGTADVNAQAQVSGGSLTANRLYIGMANGASGAVTQSAGTVAIVFAGDPALAIGFAAGANGSYSISGGTLNIAGISNVGRGGTGTFNQTGGTINASSFFSGARLPGSTGTMNLSGGALNVLGGQLLPAEVGTGTVNVSGAALVTLTNALGFGGCCVLSTTLGTVNLNGGTIIAPAVSTPGVGTSIFNFNGGTLRASGTNAAFMQGLTSVNLLSGGGTIEAGSNNTITQILGGTGGLTKTGAGTLTLSGANSYSGATTISVGTIKAGSTTALGSSSATTVSSGATLDLAGNSLAIGSLAGAGTVTNSSATAATLTSGGLGASTNFSGVLQNGTGTLSLTKAGTGTLTLSGANTYTGSTTVSSGQLNAGSTSAFGSASGVTVASGAVIDLAGFSNSIGTLQGTGTVTNNGANATLTFTNIGGGVYTVPTLLTDGSGILSIFLTSSGRLTFSNQNRFTGSLTGSNGQFGVSGTGSLNSGNYAGTITSPFVYSSSADQILSGNLGSISLVKNTSATSVLTLSGNNSAIVPTISAGTLQLGSANALGSHGTITFGGGTLQYSASNQTDYSSRFSTAASQPISVDTNGQTVTFASAMTSSGGSLSKLGAGTLTLTGANTYTGTTTISAGTLAFAGSGTTPAANAIIVNSGGTLAFNRSDTWGADNTTSSAAITVNAGGQVTSNGFYNRLWNLTLNGGTLNANSGHDAIWGSFGLSGTVGVTGAAQVLASGANSQMLLGGSSNQTTTFNIASGASLAIATGLRDYGGAVGSGLVLSGGGSLTLTGANVYTGTTTVSGGILQIGNGGTTGTLGTGAITNNAALLFNRSDALSASNLISGTGSLTQVGAGALTLSGANTYTGATTVSFGTLRAGSATAFGSNSATTVASGAQLDLAGRSLAIGSLDGAGTVTNSSVTAATLSSGGRNTSTIFSGVLQNGAGTLGVTKSGSGMLTLSGANTYTGSTTIAGGIVRAGSTSALGSNSAVTVSTGTQLDLAGNALTVGWFGGFGTITNSSATQAILTSGGLNTAATFSGVLQDGAGKVGITQTGTAMLTLVNSAITYTGPTTVSSGSIRLQDTTNFASAATVNAGARLSLMRAVTGFANRSRLSTTISGAGSLTIDSPVDGIAGGWVLFTNGAGLAADFTGTVGVNQGVLSMQSGTGLWAVAPAVTIASKGLLALRDQSLTLSSLTGAGTVINSSASGATQTLTVSTTGDMTFAGSIRGSVAGVGTDGALDQGVLNLVKTGNGTLTLSGANTFAGSTTVTGGAVSLSGSWNLGSGTATTSVASGATLSGTGAVTAATLAHSGAGTLNLTGNNLVSRLTTSGTVGPLTLTSSSALTVDSITTANARVALASRFAGSASSALMLGPGTTIATNGGALSLSGSAGPVELNGASLVTGGGALTVTGAMGSYTLPVSLDGQSTASNPLGILLRNTTIDLGGGVGSIAATGGALVLQGANSLSSTSASGISVNGSRAYGILLEAQTALTTSGKVAVSNTAMTGSTTPGMQIGAGAVITSSSGALTLGGGNTLANGLSALVFSPGAGTNLIASSGASLSVLGEASVPGSGSGILVNAPLATSGAVTMTGTAISGTGILLGDTLASAGGTLTLAGTGGATGLSSDRGISIASGTLNITSAGNDWLTGPLSGAGSLNKSGLGTLTLTGTNTYAGATTITAGTLAVQGGGMLGGGDYAGAITLGGMLTFNTVAEQRLSGPISLNANSTLTNSSTNMLTLGGELVLGGKQLTLLGNGTGADDGTPYGGGTRNMILSGLISGVGSLQIGNTVGTNVLISGANTFTGAVTLGCTACLYTPASVLTLTNSAALGTGNTSLTSLGGGEIRLQNSITLPSSISMTLSGSLSQNDIATTGAVLTSDSGNNVVEGPVLIWSGAGNPALRAAAGTSLTLNGAMSAGSLPRTLLLDGAGNITLNGPLSDGTTQLGVLVGSLSGATTGTMSLNGASTYTGTTTVAGGTLNLGGSWTPASGLATVAVSAGATLTGGGVINANTLATSGGGVLDLAGANAIGRLQTSGPIGSLRLNTGQSLTAGSIDAAGAIALTTTRGSGASLTLDPGAVLSSTASGTAITLAADRSFINNAGAGALTAPNGRWLVYIPAPAGNTFGGLDSGNRAIWATASGADVDATGNRYVFAYQPTVTISVPDQSKTYGSDSAAALAASYTLGGLEPGIDGAYLGDTAAIAFAGNPQVASAGAAANAVVSSGPYAITLAPGTVVPQNGYAVAYGAAGQLAVTPAPITITGATTRTIYSGGAQHNGYAITAGQLFGDDTLTGVAGLASGTNAGTYRDALSGATGRGLDNYAIAYVNGSLTIDRALLALVYTADAATSVYGSAMPSLSGVVAGQGFVGADGVSSLHGQAVWASDARPAAGTYGISGSGLFSPNYEITAVQAHSNASAYRVEQALLRITVNDATMTYSGAAWSGGNGLTIGDLVNGDVVGDLQGALEWTGSAQGATQVGRYDLSATGLFSPNYAITWVPGTLSILSPVVEDVAPTSVAQRKTLQRSSSVTGLCRLTTGHMLQPAETSCSLEGGAGL